MDFYTLLGVTRTATGAEIERAYRRLARLYHPGVNPGDRTSQERYRLVQEAYVVLRDAERRREYDRGSAGASQNGAAVAVSFEGFDFTAAAEGPLAATFAELFSDVFKHAAVEAIAPSRGADIELAADVSFADAMQGADIPLSVTRHERCPSCQGRGRVRREPVACPSCAGRGSRRWARGHLVFTKACETCDGRGRLESDPCRTCAGVGTSARTDVITVRVPAGVEPDTRIAVPGRGHAGARGGPAGDLYVRVDVGRHPYFRRVGRDIHVALPIGVHEAAFGARIDVPTLDKPAKLRVPAGVSSGQQIRLPGRGVGSRSGASLDPAGDLVVELQIVLPDDLSEASRDLLREFGRLNGADVRRHLFDQG